MRRTRSRKGAQGQSLVELAVFLPVFLVILLITVDLGRVYLGWVTLNNIARIGANYAALHPAAWQGTGDASLQASYQQLMQNDTGNIDCTLPATLPAPTFPDPAPNTYIVGSHASVTLKCNFRLLTPFLSSLIGDGAGNVPVSATTSFVIRSSWTGTQPIGGGYPTPTPTPTPTPSSSSTVTFYGTPDGVDSYGGGAPQSPPAPNEGQIVGVPGLYVTFYDTTNGNRGTCSWVFGDGGTSTSCNNQVTHTYSVRGTFDVTLTVDGASQTRSSYVLVGCKVPSFAGVRKDNATTVWTDGASSAGGGFAAGNISFQPDKSGNYTSNYLIGYQSLAGGLVNPPGGCSGATIVVGP